MKFSRHNGSGAWVAAIAFRNLDVVVRVNDPELQPDKSIQEIVETVLAGVDASWADVEGAILRQLYDTYREIWVPEGSRELSRAGLLRALELRAINIDVEDVSTLSQFLYFGGDGLFAGHSVEVFIDGARGDISADIVG